MVEQTKLLVCHFCCFPVLLNAGCFYSIGLNLLQNLLLFLMKRSYIKRPFYPIKYHRNSDALEILIWGDLLCQYKNVCND